MEEANSLLDLAPRSQDRYNPQEAAQKNEQTDSSHRSRGGNERPTRYPAANLLDEP